MKKKNKGRKSLTAVGAVVAAGLTPGIVTGTPASLPPNPDVEITAADAISINGETFDFDELFAMHQVYRDPRETPKVYGPPPVSIKDKEVQAPDEALREQARLDSIRRVMDRQALVYGPPPTVYGPPTPKYNSIGPDELRSIAADDKEEATSLTLRILMDFCYYMMSNTNGVVPTNLSENSDLIHDLKMDAQQMYNLQEQIERRFAVQMSEDMLTRLGTLSRIATFIVEVIKPIVD